MVQAIIRPDGKARDHIVPGDIVTLYGTGFGRLQEDLSAGEVATRQAAPELPVAAYPSKFEVIYVGTAPGLPPGLIQLNLRANLFAPSLYVYLGSGDQLIAFGSVLPSPRITNVAGEAPPADLSAY